MGSSGFFERYVLSLSRFVDMEIHSVDDLNKFAFVIPPAEVTLLTAPGLEANDIPIVGVDLPIREALRVSLYEPIDKGAFQGFLPWFIQLETLTLLHSNGDWLTAQAYLGRFGLKPAINFRAEVRRVRGESVVIGDLRLIARGTEPA